MRMLLPVLVVAIAATTAQPAAAATAQPAGAAGNPSWSLPLTAGRGAGVAVQNGAAQIDQRTAFRAPLEDNAAEGTPDTAVPTGLLTLDPHRLASPTNRVAATVAARRTEGGTATVDIRGLRATGSWSEWVPAADVGGVGTAVLPEPSRDIQARLVLTGDPGPVATGVTLTALAPARAEGARADSAPLRYRVFATREGLPGGTTANGHVIAPHDHFVALPSRRALSPNGSSDYSVRICAPTGRCAFAPVWDVGPWNTKDDYWNPHREQWGDLPQGTPESQAAFRSGYNGGHDGFGRKVGNPAGIDLGDGTFWDDLGLINNTTVTVDYLWTGTTRLTKVVDTGPVYAAPAQDADVVGVAANDASVPVECATNGWVRIGDGQYLPAAALPEVGAVAACTSTTGTGQARDPEASS